MKRQCRHKMPDGSACQANANASSGYCFFHDPNKEAERQAAQRAGGLRNRAAVLPPQTPDFELRTTKDVITLLAMTINQVRRGEIDSRVSNAIGYLAATLLRAFEVGNLEQRVSDLEVATKNQFSPAGDFQTEQFEFVAEQPHDQAETTSPH